MTSSRLFAGEARSPAQQWQSWSWLRLRCPEWMHPSQSFQNASSWVRSQYGTGSNPARSSTCWTEAVMVRPIIDALGHRRRLSRMSRSFTRSSSPRPPKRRIDDHGGVGNVGTLIERGRHPEADWNSVPERQHDAPIAQRRRQTLPAAKRTQLAGADCVVDECFETGKEPRVRRSRSPQLERGGHRNRRRFRLGARSARRGRRLPFPPSVSSSVRSHPTMLQGADSLRASSAALSTGTREWDPCKTW